MLVLVNHAVETGAPTQAFYHFAAHALATAVQNGRASDPQACTALALTCVSKAVDGGADPRALMREERLSTVLAPLPTFQALANTPRQPARAEAFQPLVDPAPYTPE